MTRISMNIDIKRVSRWLIGLSATVLSLGYLREVYVHYFGTGTILKDLGQIALDKENCLAPYYSSILMIIAALLMAVMGQSCDNRRRQVQWYVLAFVFVLMSVDESASFHEVLISPLRPLFSFSSYLHYAWIVPGSIFVLLFGLAYIRFVFAMKPQMRNRIILSGGLFVIGALGMEAIGGHFFSAGGPGNPYYIASFLIEETLEIVGLTLFATTLLKYIPQHVEDTATVKQTSVEMDYPVAAFAADGRTSAI
ncbi:MAG: hypothetical protein ACTSP0_02595 [Alphaproteobacteria bacterium]